MTYVGALQMFYVVIAVLYCITFPISTHLQQSFGSARSPESTGTPNGSGEQVHEAIAPSEVNSIFLSLHALPRIKTLRCGIVVTLL